MKLAAKQTMKTIRKTIVHENLLMKTKLFDRMDKWVGFAAAVVVVALLGNYWWKNPKKTENSRDIRRQLGDLGPSNETESGDRLGP